ncbi:ABC transporter ATP-binding protein [Pseudomonas aeruginosa]|uniref:ABC transporter ATP-binding protein n=1 Tax=Pseudomonas aeruginosa TaxID=287 RepID=UPI0032AF6104
MERQWLDGARLVAVLVLLVRFIEPLAQLTHLDQALRGAWQALDTLLRVFALAPLRSPEPGERPYDASLAAEAVELRLEWPRLARGHFPEAGAGFAERPVGPSGAGKSTCWRCSGDSTTPTPVCPAGWRGYPPLSETTLAASRNLVFQETACSAAALPGTCAWRERTPISKRCARRRGRFGLLEEIEAWPQGWDSDVGPGGALLSGGQRQRLCLARGLLSAAPLLLLDEPTASLDAASEAQVLRSLLGLRGRRTLLVVTHRPALARQADQVLLLEKGRLRLSGRHADLLVRDDWYAGFVGLAGEESSATAVDR